MVAGVIVHPPAQLGRDRLTHTDRIVRQGKAHVRAIEALSTIAPSGPVERAVARPLLAGYKRHVRAMVRRVVTPTAALALSALLP